MEESTCLRNLIDRHSAAGTGLPEFKGTAFNPKPFSFHLTVISFWMTKLQTPTNLLPRFFLRRWTLYQIHSQEPLSGMPMVRFCVDRNRPRKVGHSVLYVKQILSLASLLQLKTIRHWSVLKSRNVMPLAAQDLGECSLVFFHAWDFVLVEQPHCQLLQGEPSNSHICSWTGSSEISGSSTFPC